MHIIVEIGDKFKYKPNYYSKIIYDRLASYSNIKYLEIDDKKYTQKIIKTSRQMAKNGIVLTTIRLCPLSNKEFNRFIDGLNPILGDNTLIFIYDTNIITYHKQIESGDKYSGYPIENIHMLYDYILPRKLSRCRTIAIASLFLLHMVMKYIDN